MRREQVSAVLVEGLEPVLGKHMARAAVDGHCASLQLVAEDISPAELDVLLHRIGLGLCLFVGREKADALVATLLRQVNGAPP